MKTPIATVCRLALTLAATALITQCAHDPITRTNASQASARQISGDARAALQDLYAKDPAARRLGRTAAGVLVFPHITKGGLIVGAEAGDGVLLGRNSELGATIKPREPPTACKPACNSAATPCSS